VAVSHFSRLKGGDDLISSSHLKVAYHLISSSHLKVAYHLICQLYKTIVMMRQVLQRESQAPSYPKINDHLNFSRLDEWRLDYGSNSSVSVHERRIM